MRTTTAFLLTLALALPLAANEALDILEGQKDINEIDLPPLPEDEAAAAEGAPVVYEPAPWAPSPLDSIWDRAVLYDDPSNPYIQQFALLGTFQFGGSWGTAETDARPDFDVDGTRIRRARLGARLKVFGNTEIEAIGEFAGDTEYQRLERLKGKTRFLPNHYVSYGKFQPRFGIEQSKEPEQLLTPETTLLANLVHPAETLGIAISQECEPWDWSLGWFSGDEDRFIPGFQGNGLISANLGYTSAERLEDGSAMKTRWHLDYIYNLDGAKSASVTRTRTAGLVGQNNGIPIGTNPNFRHLVSTGVSLESERFAFESDFTLANGNLNVWGLTATPSYWVVPGTLRIVGRYHYADTDTPRGLVGGLGTGSDPFYDSSPVFVGDEVHSFYVGANVHLYQDKLVIMNGLEYALIKDSDVDAFETAAFIWHSAARVSF